MEAGAPRLRERRLDPVDWAAAAGEYGRGGAGDAPSRGDQLGDRRLRSRHARGGSALAQYII